MAAVVIPIIVAVVVVVVKVMVCAAAVIAMVGAVEALAIDARVGVAMDLFGRVDIIVLPAVVIALEFAVPLSYFADVPSDMAVDASIEVVAAITINFFVSSIVVEVLSVKVFASALELDVTNLLQDSRC